MPLEGSPQEVGLGFYCYNNLLTSLEGCPNKVGGSFYCQNNQLISLNKFVLEFTHPDKISYQRRRAFFCADNNSVSNLSTIGRTMLKNKISFSEAISIHIKEIPDNELLLVIDSLDPQKILDLNDFKIFSFLRTNLPQKYKEVCALRDIDLSADLGELGF